MPNFPYTLKLMNYIEKNTRFYETSHQILFIKLVFVLLTPLKYFWHSHDFTT